MPKSNKEPPQLKDFIGKAYTLSHSENYEKFLVELGVRKNTRIQAVSSKPTVALFLLNDNEYVLDTTYPEGRRVKVKFKIGEEVQRRRLSGCPTTSIFCVIDNKLIEQQCSYDRKVLIEREFTKDNLTVMMEVNDVRCHRFYVSKGSDHSLSTETSRRFSLWDAEIEGEESCTIVENESASTIKDKNEDDTCF